MKSVAVFKILLIVVIILLLSACSNESKMITQLKTKLTDASNEIATLKDMNTGLLQKLKDGKNRIGAEQADSSETIGSFILFDLSLSPNGEYAAFVFMHEGNDDRPLYLYNLVSDTYTSINCPTACAAIWSPDSQYFIIDQGTSPSRMGSLYAVESSKIIDTFPYFGTVKWINSSEIIYAAENDAIELDAVMELIWTTDIVTQNVHTGESKILYRGSSQFYYIVKSDLLDQQIEIVKRYVGKDTQNMPDESLPYRVKE